MAEVQNTVLDSFDVSTGLVCEYCPVYQVEMDERHERRDLQVEVHPAQDVSFDVGVLFPLEAIVRVLPEPPQRYPSVALLGLGGLVQAEGDVFGLLGG